MNSSSGEGKKRQFYCPVKDCPRGVDGGKPFPRLGQLKQVRKYRGKYLPDVVTSMAFSFCHSITTGRMPRKNFHVASVVKSLG